MPSGLTINVSAAVSVLAVQPGAQNAVRQATTPPTAVQVQAVTEAAAVKTATSLKQKAEDTSIQVPKRAEPNYGNQKKNGKKALKAKKEQEDEQPPNGKALDVSV